MVTVETFSFEQTHLWQSTLAVQEEPDPFAVQRERLRSLFRKFRERAAGVAGEIARDLPEFTVHDITHLDALWSMADSIAGDDVAFTPTEAFVLGGAFLIHDLGMGMAALPDGRDGLKADPSWSDLVATSLRRKSGQTPTATEIANPPKETEEEVLLELLRLRHAERAEKLIDMTYRSGIRGETYHLIEDPEIRASLGSVIGRIAYSHWWPLEQVQQEFAGLARQGAPMGYPPEWKIDQLKLACLLRTSDAIQIDSRRAPGFLRALRKPAGYADLHWTFQGKVQQPHRDSERIVFTSGQPFTADEARAWWVGYELIQTADRELVQVDSMLQDVAPGYRFAVRSVAGSQDPTRFSRYVRTAGWTPVDAQVRVTDVGSLVRNIGGAQLYGENVTVPLRELIQNASDAVRARRLLEQRAEDWGEVTVRLGNDAVGCFIEVEDTGVGMSEAVLVGPFLDFGKSFWNTPMMYSELVGLAGKGFVSTGRYGIGFFSAFMWGAHIVVTTRPCKEGERTRVLEFFDEVGARPLARHARNDERLRDGGTRVRVYVEGQTDLLHFLTRSLLQGQATLKELCAWLCPSLDVTLKVKHNASPPEIAVLASDWQTMDARDLLKRVWGHLGGREQDPELKDQIEKSLTIFAKNERTLINSNGEIVGRACLSPRVVEKHDEYEWAVLTVGGLRATTMHGLQGLLVSRAMTAARNDAEPIVEAEVMSRWSTNQADLLDFNRPVGLKFSDMPKVSVWAKIIRRLAGRTGKLPIVLGKSGWLSAVELKAVCVDLQEVCCPMSGRTADGAHNWSPFLVPQHDYEEAQVFLNDSIFFTTRGGHSVFTHGSSDEWPLWISDTDHLLNGKGKVGYTYGRVIGEVLDALAEAWNVSVEDIIAASPVTMNGTSSDVPIHGALERQIGTLKGDDLYGSCYVWQRPEV